jgi:hypothetical protein
MLHTPGVLSFRKAQTIGRAQSKGPPTMQSLYAGQASFLDYKKRAKPMQTRELIKRLQDPLQSGRVDSSKFLKRSKTS